MPIGVQGRRNRTAVDGASFHAFQDGLQWAGYYAVMLQVRRYREGEELHLWELFRGTIQAVNIRDYDQAQVDAWAPAEMDMERWRRRIAGIRPFVCLDGEVIVGYADLQTDGLVGHFYVHQEHQGRGVGRRLFRRLEKEAFNLGVTTMHANVSITARPFFEALGFKVEQQQEVALGEVRLTNFRMLRRLAQEGTPGNRS